jgi:hypothetical protein
LRPFAGLLNSKKPGGHLFPAFLWDYVYRDPVLPVEQAGFLRRFLDLSGTEAASADVDFLGLSVALNSYPLDIGERNFFRLVMGMADVVSNLPSLAAKLTFS